MKRLILETVDSTNTYAKNHKEEFAKDQITAIVAKEQTAGKGQFQRKWLSLKGNIAVTFYFTLPNPFPDLIYLAQLISLSLVKELIKEGLAPRIKWPNDVLIHGKKIAGVLCETLFEEKKVEIFLGLGVNVNLDKTSIDAIDQPVTSLAMEKGKRVDEMAFLEKIEKTFEKDLTLFKAKGFAPFQQEFSSYLINPQ